LQASTLRMSAEPGHGKLEEGIGNLSCAGNPIFVSGTCLRVLEIVKKKRSEHWALILERVGYGKSVRNLKDHIQFFRYSVLGPSFTGTKIGLPAQRFDEALSCGLNFYRSFESGEGSETTAVYGSGRL